MTTHLLRNLTFLFDKYVYLTCDQASFFFLLGRREKDAWYIYFTSRLVVVQNLDFCLIGQKTKGSLSPVLIGYMLHTWLPVQMNLQFRSDRHRQGSRGKCVALRYSRCFREIVIISFSPENGVRFDAICLPLGAEKYSNSEVCIPFFIASCLENIFISKLSGSIENNRVVVVSAFYETKRTAEGLVSFAKNDQQVNR